MAKAFYVNCPTVELGKALQAYTTKELGYTLFNSDWKFFEHSGKKNLVFFPATGEVYFDTIQGAAGQARKSFRYNIRFHHIPIDNVFNGGLPPAKEQEPEPESNEERWRDAWARKMLELNVHNFEQTHEWASRYFLDRKSKVVTNKTFEEKCQAIFDKTPEEWVTDYKRKRWGTLDEDYKNARAWAILRFSLDQHDVECELLFGKPSERLAGKTLEEKCQILYNQTPEERVEEIKRREWGDQ